MIPDLEVILRMLLAALLGAAVGYERERQNQPAGLRTHIILVIGSSLATTMSINLAMQFRPLVPNGDPARLAAQILPGIGFLGAGAILRYGSNIKGLTTATSLWTMAIVGMSVGAGHYIPSIVATFLLLGALITLNVFEKRFIHPTIVTTITVTADDRDGFVRDLKTALQDRVEIVQSPSVQKNVKGRRIKIEVLVKVLQEQQIEEVIEQLTHVRGVRGIKVA